MSRPGGRTRIALAQSLEQARRAVGEQTGHGGDVRVDGADGYPEAGRDPDEGVVAAQVHQSDERSLVRREFAPAVTLTGDDEHRDPLYEGMREVECGRIGNQQVSCADGLRLRTPPPTAREPCALRSSPRLDRHHPISGHVENAHWNEHPRPFVWTKTADEIIDKVAAYCRRISDSDHY